jgi:hypothetical protein
MIRRPQWRACVCVAKIRLGVARAFACSRNAAARIAEWREKAKEPREHRSVIEGLQQGAKRLAARSAELEKLADAAKPLYDSLDDAQKGRFRALLHIAAGKHWHHGHEGFRHS